MICNLCPRKCNVDRSKSTGTCGMTEEIKIAKIMLHMWEEPCISGKNGSGTIFFSGCPLKCVYCQNKDISHQGYGKGYTVKELSEEILRLQEMGASNINLVTPTHFSTQIRESIDLIKGDLKIPVVYNTSGYELPEEIYKMRGYVDVFLTDIKYFSPVYSKKYSKCQDYYERARASLFAMLSLQPKCVFDQDGMMKKGVILRHLVLPGLRRDSIAILEDIKSSIDISGLTLSLMAQYTPQFCDEAFKELKRKITTFEYESVVDRAVELGYTGYIQDKSASSTLYTPNFKEDN